MKKYALFVVPRKHINSICVQPVGFILSQCHMTGCEGHCSRKQEQTVLLTVLLLHRRYGQSNQRINSLYSGGRQ